jgi:dTDP-4-dehydrorhamnose reductase
VLEETSGTSIVIRTSWLYSKTGSNFVKTMLRLMGERDELSVVADQIGTPTWADSLAKAVWAFVDAPETSGIFHWADSGETNWQQFAVAIQEEAVSLGLLEKSIPIHAIKTEDYPTAAARPRYSVLDCSSTRQAINMQPAEWRTNLRQMLKGMAE